MKRILTVTVLAAALVAAIVQTGSAQSSQRLSKNELRSLLASAKSMDDHHRLGAHYKAETERLLAEAKEHEEMAEMYRRNPHPLTSKNPAAIGEQHCRNIAKSYRQAAAKMQALAAMHEDMAKKAM